MLNQLFIMRAADLLTVSFTGEFLPNLDLRNTISTYTKDFSHGNFWPKLANFCQISNFQITRFP
jgi:hypothetical protein